MNMIPFAFEIGASVKINNGDYRWDGCKGVVVEREEWDDEKWYEVEIHLSGAPEGQERPRQSALEEYLIVSE
jgi:hypothetical protein